MIALSNSGTVLPWFAVQVTPGREVYVFESLKRKGYCCLLPTHRARHNRFGGIREFNTPLFPGYLFCQLSLSGSRMSLLTTPHLLKLVAFNGVPHPLASDEVEMLERIIATGVVAESWPYMREGDPIELVNGPLAGMRGTLVSFKEASHFVVAIEILQRSIAVKILPDYVSIPAA